MGGQPLPPGKISTTEDGKPLGKIHFQGFGGKDRKKFVEKKAQGKLYLDLNASRKKGAGGKKKESSFLKLQKGEF